MAATERDRPDTQALEALVGGRFGRVDAVRLRATLVRPRSVVRRYEIVAGGAPRGVVVKSPRPGTVSAPASPPTPALGPPSGPARPRLVPLPEPEERSRFEADALGRVEADLAAAPDGRLFAVAFLGTLPGGAIVMAEARQPRLRELVYRTGWRPREPDRGLEAAFSNAGAWLARYHRLDPPDTTARHASRSAIVELGSAFAGYLEDRARALERPADVRLLAAARERMAQTAGRALPSSPPLGLGHGDFALRNVLVAADGRVGSLDMWTRWRPPIYEDIATFLGSLRTSVPRAVSGGRWPSTRFVEAAERSFVAGYFGRATVPIAAIRLYELVLLLDRWGGAPGVGVPSRGLATRARAAALWRSYGAEARRLLTELAD